MKRMMILVFAAVLFSSCAAQTKNKNVFPYIYKKGDCDYIFVAEKGLIKDTIRAHMNRITYKGTTYVFKFDEHKCDIVDTAGLKVHDKLYY